MENSNSQTMKFIVGTKLKFEDDIYEIYSIRDQDDPKLYFWNVNNEDDQHNIYESDLKRIIKEGICKVITIENQVKHSNYKSGTSEHYNHYTEEFKRIEKLAQNSTGEEQKQLYYELDGISMILESYQD